jgi:hypothetical protein
MIMNPLHGVESGEYQRVVFERAGRVGIHYMELKGTTSHPSLDATGPLGIHYMELKARYRSYIERLTSLESITWS